MKKATLLFTALVFIISTAFVSDTGCSAWDMTTGTVIGMSSYDAKGKLESTSMSTVKTVTTTVDKTVVDMETVMADAKGKEEGRAQTSMTCENGKISIDLRGFVSPSLTKESKDTEMKIDGNMLDYPAAMTDGQALSDGNMVIHTWSGGKEVSTTTIKIYNRKVASKETKTTPAGTYECYKITYTEEASMVIGGMNLNVMKPMQVTEWFSYKVGTVRSETYKEGKLQGYSELTSYKKP
jgi:hypothetical protein